MLVSFGCADVQAPLGCRAQEDTMAPALPRHSAGAIALNGTQKIPERKGLVFPIEILGVNHVLAA
jgi:hypothetical protein